MFEAVVLGDSMVSKQKKEVRKKEREHDEIIKKEIWKYLQERRLYQTY